MRLGDVIAERFEIERLVGSGGMGAVYRARDRRSGEPIALKLLHNSGIEDEIRFAREGRVLSELEHPGIVRHVDHGVTASGDPYLAMEWIEGEDLAQRIWRSTLRIDEIVTLGRSVSEALAVAHARGVVHRDIKPSNLLLPAGQIERVKVVDFGIARFAAASRAVTRTGHVLGALSYIAPEQARGDRQLDARVDVFALGCVLFECLTGRVPFEGKQLITLLTKIVLEDAPRAGEIRPSVPEAIDDLVARMLSRDPDGRPSDCARVAAELAALSEAALVPPAPASVRRPSLSAREQRLVAVILADMTLGSTSFDVLRAAVEPFEARVERLEENGCIGAALAGPGSAGDQAAHAARCALAMRAVLPDAPMALCTGPAVLRGRLPMGPLIDRAMARLRDPPAGGSGAASPRPILLDEVTRDLLDPRFEVHDGPKAELRGELRAAVTSPVPLLGRVMPCVGRDREIALLESTLHECIKGSASVAMLVTGPPGIGKSRLRLELLQRIKDTGAPVAIGCAQGQPLRAGAALGAVAEIVQGLTGGPLDSAKSALSLAPVDSARGADVAPAEDSRALADRLLAACERGPVLISLEDLQWIDLPSLDLLDVILRRAKDSSSLVIGFGRPEVHDLAPNKLWVSRNIQEIRLGELTRKASARLVRTALGDAIDPVVVEQILARAGGNPHTLSELARAASHGTGGELPDILTAIMLGRLSALPPAERRLLRAASLLAEPFSKDAVAALLGDPEGEIDARLKALVDRDILSRQRSAGHLSAYVYSFRQALMREGAYRMLTEGDRALGHKLAEARQRTGGG